MNHVSWSCFSWRKSLKNDKITKNDPENVIKSQNAELHEEQFVNLLGGE